MCNYNIEEVQAAFNSVIAYSQGIADPDTTDLFERWYKQKLHFIKLFGDKLIYECPEPVHFTLDEKEKKKRWGEFIETIYATYLNPELTEFLEANGVNSFFENLVDVEWPLPNGKKIPKGMKLVKSFKFFEENEHTLDIIQTLASQIIQEDKVEGTLCFSVHPLDYLSSSCNTYNWRSCHALDGEYRAGNLSYMVDSSTVVCYLKGADNVKIPFFPDSVPWNSKKWRMLLFFADNFDMIMAGRQYPFSSRSGLDIVREYIFPVFQMTSQWSQWQDEWIDYENSPYPIESRYIVIRRSLVEDTKCIQDGWLSYKADPLHYNDLLSSSCYKRPFFMIENDYYWMDLPVPHFTIGGEVLCLHCGKHSIEDSNTMRCDACEEAYGCEQNDDYGFCTCCGARVALEDCHYVDDEEVCDRCFQEECFVCEDCGEVYFNNNKVYDKENERYLCKWCAHKADLIEWT